MSAALDGRATLETASPAAPVEAAGTPIGIRGRLRMKDGRELEFEGGQAVLASWEEYALRNGIPLDNPSATQNLQALYVAYEALEGGRAEGEGRPGFQTWRRDVYGVVEFENVIVPPTRPAPSAA